MMDTLSDDPRIPRIGVYTAIAAVSRDMAERGISKDRKNQQQGYSFRGIDDMYNALALPLARNGLVVIPRVVSRECTERQSAKGGALFYVVVHVEFDFVSAKDGSKHTVSTYGEAMDSADKATNKAMSAAYKYAAMMTFCIPTESSDDADATTHEVVSINETMLEQLREAADGGVPALQAAFAALPASAGKKALWDKHGPDLKARAAKAAVPA